MQQSDRDPLEEDAAWLGKAMGLPQDEVYARLQLQQAAGDLEQKLEADLGDSFGGLWLDQGASFGVNVGLASGGPAAVETYIQGTPFEEITTVVQSQYPLSDLRAWTDTFLAAAVKDLGSAEGKFDLGIDIPGNRVVIRAASTDLESQLEGVLTNDVSTADASAFQFEVGELAKPTLDIYGGLALSGCTSGFSTRTTTGGQRGITTAAHCGNTQSYAGYNLPFQAGDKQGNQDVQWHSLPNGLTAQPWARDGSGNRTITGTLGRSGQPVGALVCGYGMTGGYRCGRIVFKDYAPNWVNSPAATFMVLHQSGVTLSQPGDSGGPWYAGGVAYGINSGVTDGTDAVYMAINYISSLNIAVLTG